MRSPDFCVCDSGRESCCSVQQRLRARARMAIGRRRIVLGDWAGVSNASAESYCKSRWPSPGTPGRSNEQAWAGCIDAIRVGRDPSSVMGPAPGTSGGGASQTITDIFGAFGKAIAGGLTGAAQTQGAMAQQTLLMQQQAARARQTRTLVILGVAGLGAYMLLRNRG